LGTLPHITSIALGSFDGMHLAHQELFRYLDDNSSAIVVIEKEIADLTPHRYREEYTKYPIVYYNLKDIQNLSGEEFIKFICSCFVNLQKIVVGYDFHFGHKRAYDIFDLKRLFAKEVVVVDEFFIDGISVHSKYIRQHLIDTQIKEANLLLGREYSITGTIISGQGIGKKELVPTLNLQIVDNFLLPSGVFKTYTSVDDIWYKSISFIGHRETTDGNFAVETHIINQEISTPNNHTIKIRFIDKIRDNRHFDSLSDLKQQIMLDIKAVGDT